MSNVTVLAGLVASADSQVNYIMGWVGAVVAIGVFAGFWQFVTNYEDSGDFPNKAEVMKSMEEIGAEIHEGATNFMETEMQYLVGFMIVIFIALIPLLMTDAQPLLGLFTGLAFLFGGSLSFGAGYAGMFIATKANMKTVMACTKGMSEGLTVAFRAGAVMGFGVVGLSLFGLTLLATAVPAGVDQWKIIAGFGFGGSCVALFARVGGGVYTKAADVGADLVGKVEAGIPEDDPRNPAVVADNVGDNVGDVAGMGADLFESYSGSIIAAAAIANSQMAYSATATPQMVVLGLQGYEARYAGIALPFFIAGFGIVASFLGTFLVKADDSEHSDVEDKASSNEVLESLLMSIRKGIWGAMALQTGLTALACYLCFGNVGAAWRIFSCTVIGLLAGIIIGEYTEYVTSFTYDPTQSIAKMATTGPATVIIQGLGVGMISTVVPTITLVLAIIISYVLAHQYGIAIAAVGMLSTLGITLATDAYGPVADNAGGIAEMAEFPEMVRDNTDALDAMGNTTAATGKGFAIGSAVLTAAGLFAAFLEESQLTVINLADPQVLCGILIGAMLPSLFAALTMLSVGRSAQAIMFETRRQFQACPELKLEENKGKKLKGSDGETYPDSAKCVKIATDSAIREMVIPGTLAVFMPVIVGYILSQKGLAGLLMGSLSSGFMLGITMNNAGGAWDNSKKWVEKGGLMAALDLPKADAGKGSDMHTAVVVGDTVGDPFKDTSGPALNILIKLMTIVSLVCAPAFNKVNPAVNGVVADWTTMGVVIGVVIMVVIFGILYFINNMFNADHQKMVDELAEAAKELARQQKAEADKAAAADAADATEASGEAAAENGEAAAENGEAAAENGDAEAKKDDGEVAANGDSNGAVSTEDVKAEVAANEVAPKEE